MKGLIPNLLCSLVLFFVWRTIFGIGIVSETSLQPKPKSTPPENDAGSGLGWRDIHVFVGETIDLAIKYKGPYSQTAQDSVVKQLLKHKQKGFFVDLAANHAAALSNTFALERYLNWDGICIEPNSKYWPEHLHRKCTLVGAVVGENRMEAVNFVVPQAREPSGGIERADFDNQPNKTKIGVKKVSQKMYTVPLLEIFQRYNAPREIDYLSLDVEGAEYFVMKGFPFDRYRMRILTIERPSQALVDLLYRNNYVYLAAFNFWGDETLFASKTTLELLNSTVVSELCRTDTRLMEMPQDLLEQPPRVIEKPLGPTMFKKKLAKMEEEKT